MNLPQQLAALFGHKPEPALDILPVPPEHVEPVLNLIQAVEDCKGVGHTKAEADLWTYIYKAIPYIRHKSTTLDTSVPLRPVLQVHGTHDDPVVGGDGIIEVHPIPSERLFNVFELLDLQGAGPLHRYNLWKYICSFVPAVAASVDSPWRIEHHAEFAWVVRREKDKKEDSQRSAHPATDEAASAAPKHDGGRLLGVAPDAESALKMITELGYAFGQNLGDQVGKTVVNQAKEHAAREALHNVLAELVHLKNVKDLLDVEPTGATAIERNAHKERLADYKKRKEAAWAKAHELVAGGLNT